MSWLDSNADGLALLLWCAIGVTVFLLVAAAVQWFVHRVDESNPSRHLRQVTAGRASQASSRDHARDAAWRDEVARRARWIAENTWHGEVPEPTNRGDR